MKPKLINSTTVYSSFFVLFFLFFSFLSFIEEFFIVGIFLILPVVYFISQIYKKLFCIDINEKGVEVFSFLTGKIKFSLDKVDKIILKNPHLGIDVEFISELEIKIKNKEQILTAYFMVDGKMDAFRVVGLLNKIPELKDKVVLKGFKRYPPR